MYCILSDYIAGDYALYRGRSIWWYCTLYITFYIYIYVYCCISEMTAHVIA